MMVRQPLIKPQFSLWLVHLRLRACKGGRKDRYGPKGVEDPAGAWLGRFEVVCSTCPLFESARFLCYIAVMGFSTEILALAALILGVFAWLRHDIRSQGQRLGDD